MSGMRIARDIMQSEIMAPFVNQEMKPGADLNSDDECWPMHGRRASRSIIQYQPAEWDHHQNRASGRCAPARSRHYGLRVVDASIMPELVSGNTNAPTIMIAEKPQS